MTTPDIRPTEEQDIPALRDVIDQTELFPSEMLPDLLAPFLADADTALWLTASLNGRALALCYAVPEEMADGVCVRQERRQEVWQHLGRKEL
ncbi:MAG: hypothetical protein AAGP08_16575, partial [Pseudomonadota bacterium]